MGLTNLGVIGTGNMGSAIIKGLVQKGTLKGENIRVSDINSERLEQVKAEFGIGATFTSNAKLVRESTTILIAVKPQVLETVLTEIKGEITAEKLFITIVAGIPMSVYAKVTGKTFHLARVMPNTPALVNSGVSCVSFNKSITVDEKERCFTILKAIGNVHEVDEKNLDAVTGLSGSGPAYVFNFIEGLIDGGVKMGLPRDLARALAIDTVLGSTKLVQETGKHPMALKDQVTSPGGTTIEALQVLEDGNLRGVLMRAVEVATEKSRRLSAKFLEK